MMQTRLSGPADRLRGALGALAMLALIGWLLIAGLGVPRRIAQSPAMRLLDFVVPPPPPPEPQAKPKPKPSQKQEGKASPPNRVSRATEVAAPVPVPTPPPIPAAVKPAQGSDATSGNAPIAGPGTGAGGSGDGTGSGGAGNGAGSGGTALQLIRGHIDDDDYPREALRAHQHGTVGLRFIVGVDGRVSDCTVTRSSGSRSLDETTCRLIKQRFRYRPSRDAQGRPYADTVTGEHEWELYERPDSRDEDDGG